MITSTKKLVEVIISFRKMKNMFPIYYFKQIVGILFLFLLVACQNNHEEVVFDEHVIFLKVQPEDLDDSRSLIGDNDALASACTPTAGGQAIGIWSAFKLNSNDILTQNVLGDLNGDVSLVYDDGTSWDNWAGWTYGIKAVYWKMNATYYFNAYFPKENGMTEIQQNTTSIRGKYNTITTQKDLMVCRQVVDTSADDFTAAPVPLIMKHALATLKFIFLAEEGYSSDVLKSFSLNNTLITSAKLNYNTESITINNWVDGTLSDDVRIFEWADNNGIPFNATTEAVPYTTGNGTYQTDDGYLFIIPQQCTVPPTFNCKVGVNTFENVSLGTTQFEPGLKYIYTIKIKGEVISGLEYTVVDWSTGSGDVEFN